MEIITNVDEVRNFICKVQQKHSVDNDLTKYFNFFADTYIELKKTVAKSKN